MKHGDQWWPKRRKQRFEPWNTMDLTVNTQRFKPLKHADDFCVKKMDGFLPDEGSGFFCLNMKLEVPISRQSQMGVFIVFEPNIDEYSGILSCEKQAYMAEIATSGAAKQIVFAGSKNGDWTKKCFTWLWVSDFHIFWDASGLFTLSRWHQSLCNSLFPQLLPPCRWTCSRSQSCSSLHRNLRPEPFFSMNCHLFKHNGQPNTSQVVSTIRITWFRSVSLPRHRKPDADHAGRVDLCLDSECWVRSTKLWHWPPGDVNSWWWKMAHLFLHLVRWFICLKQWFSIVMLVYQRVNETTVYVPLPC